MSNTPNILIVDDSEDDALLMQVQLKRTIPGAVFTRVENEASMRDAVLNGEWDLVICDHTMPQFDSSRAMALLRELGLDIPLVIFSGNIDAQRALNAMRGGAQDFVPKQDPQRLLPVVERELRNVRDRRAHRRAESSVVQLSKYDPLTRLPNQSYLLEAMEAALVEIEDRSVNPALIYANLDRFMRINDSFGYAAGDTLIRQVAVRLQQAAGPGNFVARLGQDSFAVFLPRNSDPFNARTHADRLVREFSEPFTLQGQQLFITMSLGVSLYPDHGADPPTLVKNAESAMFTAKRRGGNRTQLYERELNHSASQRLKLENALRQAVTRNELFLLYQPILDQKTGSITANEALIRWSHPDLGIIPPDQFIPIAEETGLILDIGDWVLLNACTQTKRWQDYGHRDLRIAVNFSSNQFQREGAASRVMRILKESELPPAALELEITEGVAMSDAEGAIETLKSLKSTGAQIAIDDFGTGFSSLSYLKRYPIDILKIDKSFVRDLPQDQENAAIVNTICVLAKALNLTAHAEGVETAEQLSFLNRIGCQRIQGYYVSRPIKASEMMEFLSRYNTIVPVSEATGEVMKRRILAPSTEEIKRDWRVLRAG